MENQGFPDLNFEKLKLVYIGKKTTIKIERFLRKDLKKECVYHIA